MTQDIQQIPSPVDAYDAVFVPAMLDPLLKATMRHIGARRGERVLDLACGTGIVARRLAPLVGGEGVIVAVDVSPEMLARARSLPVPAGARVEWLRGDATALELGDDTFDLSVCQQGLQYFADPAAGLAESRRTLRDGGRVVASTWRGLAHAPLFEQLVEVEARHLEQLGVTYEELAAPFLMDGAEDLRGLFEAAGFEHVVVTEATVEARFPSAARFVEDVEVAYASVMPQFAEDPAALQDFVARVERDMRTTVERYRVGAGIRTPMKTHITTARA